MLEINEKLKKSVLSTIPKFCSKTEKMVRIYFELCKKLEYSMSFFMHDFSTIDYYTNPDNLKDIDGEERKDVVCYTFSAIMSELLLEAGVCDEEWFKNSKVLEKDGKLGYEMRHKYLTVNIGNNDYEIDATESFLGDTGLNAAKYSGEIIGIECVYGDEKFLQSAIEKVTSEYQKLKIKEMAYLDYKKQDGALIEFSLEERKEFFLQNATSITIPKYSLTTFYYFLKLKHLFFNKMELGGGISKHVEMLFALDLVENVFKCFFLFNKDGYINDKGYENFEGLEIYIISPKTRKWEEVDIETFKKRCRTRYDIDLNDEDEGLEMANDGKIEYGPKFDKDKNIIGYVRHILKDDKYVSCDKDGNVLE